MGAALRRRPAAARRRRALRDTEVFWKDWASRIRLPDEHQDLVMRSLITLKACTYRPNGAIVAAPTFGLPETPGGERNWDYRFTWIRDSVLALQRTDARPASTDEAQEFGEWFIDAIGGAPGQFQIMYGIRGERILTEIPLPWLAATAAQRRCASATPRTTSSSSTCSASSPASSITFAQAARPARRTGRPRCDDGRADVVARSWTTQGPRHLGDARTRAVVHRIEGRRMDGDRSLDPHDRALGLADDKAPWEKLRDKIRDEISTRASITKRNTFTQYYGSKNVDASLLFIVMAGCCRPTIRASSAR